jgi:hypothetical protein
MRQNHTKHTTMCKTYECAFVVLVTQHAMRMRQIVTLACLAVQHFSTLSRKQQDFFFFLVGGII